jgi:EmrB/QacA subfamily drug resistance transporter
MRSLLVLSIGTSTFALAQSTVFPALAQFQREFGVDATAAAWLVTGYLHTAAVFTPVMGRLGDMFGKRRILVLSLIAFALGSVVSALGTSLEVVVAGRVLQGVGGGVFPLSFGIIRDEFPRERIATSIGLIASIAGVGGGIGIVGGGLLIDQLSWHWMFWVSATLALVAALSTHLFVPESPVRTPGRVDVRGALVLAVGLVLVLFAISRATVWGWGDTRLLALGGAGLLVLVSWTGLQRRTAQPLADMETLATPAVLMTNIATFLVGFGMFGSFILVPQLAQAPASTGFGFGMDATSAGLLLLPGSLTMLVTGPIAGRLANRFGVRVPLVAGGAMATIGLLLLAIAHGSEHVVLAWNMVMSIGIGFAFASMPNLIVAAVRPDQTGEATGFNALVRSAGASAGSAVAASILAGSGTGLVPAESGFTTAFLVGAGVCAIATFAAVRVPEVVADRRPSVGISSPLAEPAVSMSTA